MLVNDPSRPYDAPKGAPSDADKKHLGAEGYQLKILDDRVLVEAPTPTGVFYCCQTVLQFPEGKTVREYYTQDEIREIIAYAKFRHVMVIPEIEMPGHLVNRAFCAGNDRAYEFIDGVLSEVAELFPAPWIHIGGDEPLMQSWVVCSRCQARIETEKLGNVHGLYNYFIRRVEKIVQSKGKRVGSCRRNRPACPDQFTEKSLPGCERLHCLTSSSRIRPVKSGAQASNTWLAPRAVRGKQAVEREGVAGRRLRQPALGEASLQPHGA